MKLKKIAMAFVLLGSVVMAQSLRADIVQNGNFTSTTSFPGAKDTVTNAGLTDWLDYHAKDSSYSEVYLMKSGNAEQNPFAAGDPGTPPGLGNVAEFNNDGILYQNMNLTVGTTYTVTFWQAMSALDTTTSGPMEGYFNIYWDGRKSGGADQILTTSTMHSDTTTLVNWNQQTIHFTADSTSAYLGLEGFDNISASTSAIFLANVQVTEDTPLPPALPATLATFLGIGAIALIRRTKPSPAMALRVV